MIFYIYLGSILLFYIALISFAAEGKNKLKKQGYKFKKLDFRFRTFLQVFILSLLPIVNLIVAFAYIFSNELMEKTLNLCKQSTK